MQQYAGIYLLQNHSTCFGCPSHPSSGAHKTITAAWRSLGGGLLLRYYDLYQRLQLQFYVLLTMGAMDTRNIQSDFAVNKYLHTVASCWILLKQSYDSRNHEYKIHDIFTRTKATSAFPICPKPVCNSSCNATHMFVGQLRSYVYLTWEKHIVHMQASIFQHLCFHIVNSYAVIFSNSVPNSEFSQPAVHSDRNFAFLLGPYRQGQGQCCKFGVKNFSFVLYVS